MRLGPKLACLALLSTSPAFAQDIRGLEVCTAEKQMDRRTSCLQSNVEFLQQTLDRQQRDAQKRLAAAEAEINLLKAKLTTIEADLKALKTKPAEPPKKP
ncbi:hypothetical protein [Undibacter mobilis]|uniref:Uncharacterized protein n=1 Tax=Undibacter mobilis TaxID=2292256 RepID=A0A371B6N5_9BRAD|nr:hypothetical protein [Undibacter mobilis]RDV03214.1 hypothetical protein DXH78_00565 [Undibacter mobilis]